MIRLIIDKYIPFIRETVETAPGWQNVQISPMEPEEMTPSAVRDADALIVRTRTRIDRTLLQGSRVRFVATATIGYDHIDAEYCREAGITWTACPGCNAQAVCDYIAEVLDELCPYGPTLTDNAEKQDIMPAIPPMKSDESACIGVVGIGHVGSLVADMAEQRGWRVLRNDPPKHIGVTLDEIARNCHVITFHTPLTTDGDYPTHHLCDEAFLRCCRPDALIINAARGGVVDEAALLRTGHPCVIDTWEDEPHLNPTLLQHASRASFHIAGYSVEGKYNASRMCLDAFQHYFALPPCQIDKKAVSLQQKYGDHAPGWLRRVSDQLKAQPERFEQLRKQYKLR